MSKFVLFFSRHNVSCVLAYLDLLVNGIERQLGLDLNGDDIIGRPPTMF